MRINKFIAQNSQLSRRQTDKLIKEGKIMAKGRIVRDLKLEIVPGKDKIRINKKPMKAKQEKTYLILNKPKGYLGTLVDIQKRKTIAKLIPPRKNLKPVGRMDLETEGLLILSNDGTFINKLNDPKHEREKEYNAQVEGKITDKDIEKLKKSLKSITIGKATKKETAVTLTINEGRNRQIRKIFDSIHHPVKYLQRTRIGQIKLGSLKRGKCRLLTKEEIDA